MRSYNSFRERKPRKLPGSRPAGPLIVRRKPSGGNAGLLIFSGMVVPCAIGRSGIVARKREGDGGTPLAPMRLLGGYYRPDAWKSARISRLALGPIAAADGWCDASGDRNYNRPVPLPYPGSTERMMRDDALYDLVIVLDWNIRQRRRGGGSAIFLHIARQGLAPTEGCVAVTAATMRRLLPRLSRRTVLRVLP